MTSASTVSRVHPDNYRMYRVITYMCYLGIPAHFAFIPMFWFLGVPSLAILNIFSTLAWVAAQVLNQRGRHWLAIDILSVEAVLHSAIATFVLGWDSGFQTYLMPIITVTMINYRLRTRTMLAQAIGLVALYTVLYTVTRDVHHPAIAPILLHAMHYANIGIVFAALSIISYFFRDASLTMERRMEQLATTDMLTHLPNRRKMKDLLDAERARAERNARMFSVVLADIDFFKRINDSLGHDAGDRVLARVAGALRGALREEDSVGRWGGEEFLALLLETAPDDALHVAERMREAVANMTIDGFDQPFTVTITLGVATLRPGESAGACIIRADGALYRGKTEGRNRSVAAED